jgi:hypothetical protein
VVYIGVSGNNLKEGMYLRGDVELKAIDNAFELPRNLLVNESKVYKIENDSILTLQTVNIIKTTEKTAIVSGLKSGSRLLKELFPGVYEGMIVEIKKEEPESINPSNTSAQN